MEAKPGPVAGEAHVGVQLALEELAHQHERAVLDAVRDHVADQRRGRSAVASLGSEVAHLVGVREEHEARVDVLDQLLAAPAV